MALSDRDFGQLKVMQAACTQVEADAEALRDFSAKVAEIRARYQALSSTYQADWRRLADEASPSDAQQAELDAMVAEGGYSVLGQDTIWSALEDVRTEVEARRQALANPFD